MKNSERRKTAGFLRRSFLGVSVMALLGVGAGISAGGNLDRLDFYDHQDNLLMSFNYNSAQGQALLDGLDGKKKEEEKYVLRRLGDKMEYDGSGRLKRSSFIDWDDREVNWATYTYDAGQANFTFHDHYEDYKGKDIVHQGSYSKNDNTYTFKNKNGQVTHLLEYEYLGDGTLKRINVKDRHGNLTHYIQNQSVGVASSASNTGGPIRRQISVLGDGTAVLNLRMKALGNLKVEQYDLTGRLVEVLDQRTIAAGNHTLRYKTKSSKAATSVRLLKVSIDGDAQVHRFTTVK